MTPQDNIYAYIASATTTQVIQRSGTLVAIILNKPVSGSTISLIDGTGGSTVNLGLITNTTDVKPYRLEFNVHFKLGLRIITSGADDITVIYR